jgi:hypothetical protein
MRTRLLLFLLFCAVALNAFSQTDSVKIPEFTYYNQFFSGAIVGQKESGTSVSVAMVHGIRWKDRIALGVGVSYEDYGIARWRTMPYFFSANAKLFSVGKNAEMSFQMEAGQTRMWRLKDESDWFNYQSKGGRIYHPAITMRWKLDKISLYVKVGYKFQKIIYEQRNRWGWGWGANESVTRVERDMDRLSLHMGIGFR